VDLLDVGFHLGVLETCQADWKGARLPMATPPGMRYPYVYPRDLAAIARAHDRLGGAHDEGRVARELQAAAAFLLEAQGPNGHWGQRYDLHARDKSIYPQEDNTAHAAAVLARHVRHERRQGRVSSIESEVLHAIERGLEAARRGVYRKGINLFYSTTSIHESAMEKGYTLWTNGAYRDAYRLAVEAFRAAGRIEHADAWERRLEALEANIGRHFVQDGVWIRALTGDGRFDRRPDVTLLAPYYFGFEHLDEAAAERAANRIEHELWDPDIGLLQRYLPFREDPAVHLHAGNGPWLAYSAWLAQRHAAQGRTDAAWDILERIMRFASPEGWLPEHVSTRERFYDFIEHEWETGLDYRKEFDPAILLPNVGFSEILEETNKMHKAYQRAAHDADRAGDGIIRFATPLAWTHAEVAVALGLLGARTARTRAPAQRA
jgi:GH15 family glucan-1,4-alpha-glucosidase